jgi:hypothetical protein
MAVDEHSFAPKFVHSENSENSTEEVGNSTNDGGCVRSNEERSQIFDNIHKSVHVYIYGIKTRLHVEHTNNKASPGCASVKGVASGVAERNLRNVLVRVLAKVDNVAIIGGINLFGCGCIRSLKDTSNKLFGFSVFAVRDREANRFLLKYEG